jgi:hypothetical protein
VEQNRALLNRNRIPGLTRRTSKHLIAKSTAIQDRERSSGRRALKALDLTSGHLRGVAGIAATARRARHAAQRKFDMGTGVRVKPRAPPPRRVRYARHRQQNPGGPWTVHGRHWSRVPTPRRYWRKSGQQESRGYRGGQFRGARSPGGARWSADWAAACRRPKIDAGLFQPEQGNDRDATDGRAWQ